MSIFWFALPAAIICGILEGKRRGEALKKEEKRQEGEGVETPDTSAEVWDALAGAYTALRKTGAYIRVPWIRDCLDAMQAGRECPPDVAIAALVETGEDLNGTRWDTDDLALVFEDATKKLLALI